MNRQDGEYAGATIPEMLEDETVPLSPQNTVDRHEGSSNPSMGQHFARSSLSKTPPACLAGSFPGRFSFATHGKLKQFYFPCGRDWKTREAKEIEGIDAIFKRHRAKTGTTDGLERTEFADVAAQALSLPNFLGPLVFDHVLNATLNDSRSHKGSCSPEWGDTDAISGLDKGSGDTDVDMVPMDIDSGTTVRNETRSSRPKTVTEDRFRRYYQDQCASRCREERFFRVLLAGDEARKFLVPGDFQEMAFSVLSRHKEWWFLHGKHRLQYLYTETVIERIFFSCARTHNGRLTLQDIKRSKLLDKLMMVDKEGDINRERTFFSFEHFDILYSRFLELDADNDSLIDFEDLMRYGCHSLSSRILERVFNGYGKGFQSSDRIYRIDNPGFMTYNEFVWFCLAEEDKSSEMSFDYWFRCVDMDGDGIITLHDIEYFFKSQNEVMEDRFGNDPVEIHDICCDLLDMVKPNSQPPQIKRSDLKACGYADEFFNSLFNAIKFSALEAEDVEHVRARRMNPSLTDWDRFVDQEVKRRSGEDMRIE